MNKSIVLNTDSYKHSHYLQYPERTSFVYSYIESRVSDNLDVYPATVFMGLQMFIKDYLMKPVTMDDIDLAEVIVNKHIPGLKFNREGWEYIVKVHKGKLPIRISAVREGTLVDRSNVLLTIENTDVNCFWLTSFVETALLRAIWYPTSVATISFYIKKMMKEFLERNSDESAMGGLNFMLHDFGARGVSSFESAGIGGVAHLVNFMGTDTITALLYAREFYSADITAFSVPASEHSTMTILGPEGEKVQAERMLDLFLKEGSIVSCVSDSFDIFSCVEKIWGQKLKDKIEKSGGKLVVRPDSGIPWEVVPQIMEILGEKFGFTLNSKGFKVLPACVGVIQGDGVEQDSIRKILENLEKAGWASSNMVFGMGGALLQKVNRDTFSFAQKASFAEIAGQDVEIFKKPIGDSKKASKKGRLVLVKNNGKFETMKENDWLLSDEYFSDELPTIFYNGELVLDDSFETIRARAEKFL